MTKKAVADAGFRFLFNKAHDAGLAAALAKTPTPMVVTQHASPLNDASPVIKQYYVADGVCGFAWVTIRPGNSAAAKYANKHLGWRPAYGGGMQLWVSDFNQSMQLKEAYADAFAKVLREDGGIAHAFAGSRMD